MEDFPVNSFIGAFDKKVTFPDSVLKDWARSAELHPIRKIQMITESLDLISFW
ncbi:hypothetical protein C943_04453 [Mariniradius saccharolyticus AK6]|uniref:Uncharacterized protein n=1 Tax=Mariniradius saccharolyticus AK6 TaxID=1239962 RepID=M7XFD2_9BACT|nr:hypothetical protein C943_04453 [Mariniradius saccharolyticus AK6]